MTLQALSDITLVSESGVRLYGPGELVTLPIHEAMKTMLAAAKHFKIVKPTPLISGVTVRWLSDDDCVRGPGVVSMVDGSHPDRRVAVQMEGELRWIRERDLVEIDPWPAIDAKLEDAWPYLAIEGEESPKVIEVRDWMLAHFDDREPWKR
jgi:hypothetical protein